MKFFTIAGIAAVATIAMVGQTPLNALKGHTSALQAAKSFTATFNLTRAQAAPIECTVTYSKPGMFKIETPDKLVICDGKMLRFLNKTENAYTESEASTSPANADEVWAWAAFYNPDPFKNATAITPGAKRTIKGNPVQEYTMKLGSDKSATLYIDTKLGIARGSSVKKGDTEVLTIATALTVGAEPLADSTFAWAPPAGAKKAEAPKPTEDVTYAKVDPIFQQMCTGCHSGMNSKGSVDLSSYSAAMNGRKRIIVAGQPDNSSLYREVRSGAMPKDGRRLNKEELKTIENWILGGAKE